MLLDKDRIRTLSGRQLEGAVGGDTFGGSCVCSTSPAGTNSCICSGNSDHVCTPTCHSRCDASATQDGPL
jgi:hypothetical protein